MAQAIIYCDRCGKIIPPSEIGRGRAIVGETAGLCPECVAGISPEEREELRRRLSGEAAAATAPQAPARARAPSSRVLRRAEDAEGLPEPAGQPRSHTGLVVAGLAAGVLGGVAIAVLIAGGKKVEDHASDPVTPGTRRAVTPAGPRKQGPPSGHGKRPPATPAEPATPAAKRITGIKHVFDPSFADYTEGRKILRAFLKEFPGTPEAERAKARLAEMSIGETARAKEALAKAAKRAKKLVSRGWFEDAARAFDGARERFGENEWFKTEGEKEIASALEGIEKSRLDAAKRALARADGLLGEERFDEARGALADRAGWPEEIRKRAEELVAKIASAGKAAEEKRLRIDAWIEVLIGLNEAGKKGLAEVRAHIESGRKRLRELGVARDKIGKLDRIERRFRSAKFVEDMTAISLGNAKTRIRLRWKGEVVAVRILGIEGGALKVKTTGGAEETIPISQMTAEDVVTHARVMRGSTKDPVKAGSYYFLRGDMESARKVIDGLASGAALALEEDIDLVASAFKEREARRIAAAEAAKRAAEAAEAARKKSAFEAAVVKGLVAYWKFDEAAGAAKAEDETAGYEGKLSDPIRMPGAEGKIGGAYSFDGNNVVTTDLGGFNEDFTWTAWIRTSNRNGAVVGNSEPRWSQGGKAFYVWGGKTKVDVGWVGYVEGRTVVSDGEWHHMAVTAEFETAGGNDTVKIYVDGELDATKASWDINKPERNHRIRIGHVDHQGKYFTGLIDEVRVYKRALLAKEIKSIAEGRVMGLPASSGPTEGLVGHWTFDSEDNPAGDSSGKGLHGKLFGVKWSAKGKVGGALEFAGESGFVDLPDISTNFTRGFTFAVWAYPTAIKDYARFIDIGNGPASNNLLFARISRSANLTFEAYQGGRRRELGAKDALALNSWQHFVGTLDESGKATIYRDGVVIASGQMPLPQDVIRTSNYIGRSNWDGNQFYQGLMDDLRVYNRALTADEAKALFEGKATPAAPVARPSGPTGGLVGHWTFDNKDNPGGDSSGEGCHGDVFSAKWTAKGKVGGALEFDGERSFVDLPDGFADFTTGFTVAVWACPTAAKSYARFIEFGNGAMVDNVFFA
ncbi:MAG: LamG-like jellyroll fold domain-containing protein, partial [Planctomycetota bacterium]